MGKKKISDGPSLPIEEDLHLPPELSPPAPQTHNQVKIVSMPLNSQNRTQAAQEQPFIYLLDVIAK